MKLPLSIKIGFTVLVSAAVLWAATNKRLYDIAILNVIVSMGLAAVLVLHLRLKPVWTDAASVLAGAGILSLIDFQILHFNVSAFGLISFLGLASFVALAVRATWSTGEERTRMGLAFAFAFLSLSVDAAALPFHALTLRLHPNVLDLYLYSFDGSLRVQLSFLLGQMFAANHHFGDASMFIYIGLPIVMGIVAAGRLLREEKSAIPALAAFLLTAPIGVIFYNLFPAIGPLYIFGERFPWNPLTSSQTTRLLLEPIPAPGFRNAMPSLHIAWVLLAWWFSRGLSAWERSVALVFVTFTVIATLGSGEHYFIDLVVGCAFGLFIYSLCQFPLGWSRKRLTALAVGLALTLAWFAALRFGVKFFWLSPVLPWLTCAATVAAVFFLQNRVDSASPASISELPADEPAAVSVS